MESAIWLKPRKSSPREYVRRRRRSSRSLWGRECLREQFPPLEFQPSARRRLSAASAARSSLARRDRFYIFRPRFQLFPAWTRFRTFSPSADSRNATRSWCHRFPEPAKTRTLPWESQMARGSCFPRRPQSPVKFHLRRLRARPSTQPPSLIRTIGSPLRRAPYGEFRQAVMPSAPRFGYLPPIDLRNPRKLHRPIPNRFFRIVPAKSSMELRPDRPCGPARALRRTAQSAFVFPHK